MKFRFRLKYLRVLTPTPMNNVNSLEHRFSLPNFFKEALFSPVQRLNKNLLKSTLQEPELNPNIPGKAQWLSGEGAGSWFVVEPENSLLRVTRYSPGGQIECTGLYENKTFAGALPDNSFHISYPSNCKEITFANTTGELHFERNMDIQTVPFQISKSAPEYIYQ